MTVATSAATDQWSYWRVLRDPRVGVFLLGAVVSQVGDGMIITALPLEALRVAGSVGPAAAVSLVQLAPYILATVLAFGIGLSPVRVPNRALLNADCALRFTLFTGLGVLSVTGHMNLGILVVGLLLGSVLRLLANSSRRVVVTIGMVPPEGRYAANGLLATSNSLALYVVGPVVGGLMATVAQPGVALIADGVSFAALFAVTMATVPRMSTTQRGQRLPASGWRVVRRNPVVLLLFVVVFFFNFLYMPIEVALPLFVRGDLHGRGTGLGLVWSAFGIGALCGSLLMNWLRRLPRHRVLIGIITGWALSVAALSATTSVAAAAVCFAVGGLIYAPFSATCYSYLQSLLVEDEQQPVMTLWTAGATIASPTGLALGGVIVGALGAAHGILLSAILTLLLAPLAALGLRGRIARPGAAGPKRREDAPGDR